VAKIEDQEKLKGVQVLAVTAKKIYVKLPNGQTRMLKIGDKIEDSYLMKIKPASSEAIFSYRLNNQAVTKILRVATRGMKGQYSAVY